MTAIFELAATKGGLTTPIPGFRLARWDTTTPWVARNLSAPKDQSIFHQQSHGTSTQPSG